MALKLVDGNRVRVPGGKISPFWKRRFGALGKMDNVGWRAFHAMPLADQYVMIGSGREQNGQGEKAKESYSKACGELMKDRWPEDSDKAANRLEEAASLAQKHGLRDLEVKAATMCCEARAEPMKFIQENFFSPTTHSRDIRLSCDWLHIALIAKKHGLREIEVEAATEAWKLRMVFDGLDERFINPRYNNDYANAALIAKDHGLRELEVKAALWAFFYYRRYSHNDLDEPRFRGYGRKAAALIKKHRLDEREVASFCLEKERQFHQR